MKTLFVIAWRNIWRNPGRSGVLLMAVVAGLWAGVVTVGTMNGMLNQRVNYLIDSEIAHAQIHNPEFLLERRPSDYIHEIEKIVEMLESDHRVSGFAPRVLADGMLQSPVKTAGVRIRGIDITKEPQTTSFHENLVDGKFLDSDIRNPVVVGQRLLESHKLRIGNRLVLTFEDVNGDLTSAAFTISGSFQSVSSEYDESHVFVRSEDLLKLISPDKLLYHEIAVRLQDIALADEFVRDLSDQISGIKAQTWNQISPELSTLVELGGVMLHVVTLIIMLALAFGILNTMLMAIFERLREIGMLLSIGMSRSKVFLMIMLESVVLTLTGAITGIILAMISIRRFGETGINFEMFAEGIASLGWDHVVYPVLSTQEFTGIIVIVIVITMLSSLYPAIKAMRQNPLEVEK